MVGTCLDFATCTLDHIVNVEAHRFKFNLPSTKVKLGANRYIDRLICESAYICNIQDNSFYS